MKYLLILLLLVIVMVAGCETSEKNGIAVEFLETTDEVQPISDPEPIEPIPNCQDGIKNGAEQGVDCGGSCVACYSPPTHENLIVINGGFENENSLAFTDYDNNVELGYVYARNIIGPINGKADMKIKITQAKKDAINRPGFKVLLSEPLIVGQTYEAGFSIRDIKGSYQLHSMSLGQAAFKNKVEFTEDNYKVVKFVFSADVASKELFINFVGTRTAEFRMDDLYVNPLN